MVSENRRRVKEVAEGNFSKNEILLLFSAIRVRHHRATGREREFQTPPKY